ncbi:MAG: hypothetical protein IKT46_03850 [Clostridia bacterium]|nr:hypothetical protein [Clostridia bacterium]
MKKLGNIIFCLLFAVLLALPFVFTNFEKNVKSEIDGKDLPELETDSIESFVKSADEYLDKRIGFRAETLELYQQINDKLFSEMEHPNHMYGKNGHMYYKWDNYIADWQHLNLDKEWADGFAAEIKGFQDYSGSKGKSFIYALLPDKKTVYPEYFPDGYNVKGDVSRTDQLLAALEEHEVNYYWALDTMLEGKRTMAVNNKKYDITHWNENGTFIVVSEMLTRVGLEPLDIADYEVTQKLEKYLPNSDFVINEEVPLYTLTDQKAVLDRTWHTQNELYFPDGENLHYFSYHRNPENADAPKLLVIHDSYLAEKEKFFCESVSELFFIHRDNIKNQDAFKYYVDIIDPDIIIFENPERSLMRFNFNGAFNNNQ